jgi:CHAD domain-containing protein
MKPPADVSAWATMLVRRRIAELEAVRSKARKHWKRGKYVHKLRTQARRLRAAVEDLRACIPGAQLVDESKALGQSTGKVRDAEVLIRKLQRYGRFALPAERLEIDAICKQLRKRRDAAQKPARAAVAAARLKLRT